MLNLLSHFSQTTTDSSGAASAIVNLFIGALLIFSLSILLLYALPAYITRWKLYNKANRPGWAALIPFYDTYMMGDVANKVKLSFALIGLYVVSIPVQLAEPEKGSPMYLLLFLIFLSMLILSIALLVNFAMQYDGGVGFWLAYMFLPIVAVFLVNKVNHKDANQSAGAQYLGGNSPQPIAMPQASAPTVSTEPSATPVSVDPMPVVDTSIGAATSTPSPVPTTPTPTPQPLAPSPEPPQSVAPPQPSQAPITPPGSPQPAEAPQSGNDNTPITF